MRFPCTIAVAALGPLAAGTLSAQEDKDPTFEARLSAVEKKLESGDQNQDKNTMRAYWKDGLRIETADKRYKVRLGARLMYDAAFFDPDDETRSAVESGSTRIEDGTEFRRARIELSGEVPERIEWAAGFDFAKGDVSFRKLYVGFKDLPIGNLRVGQMKEPFGLEQITSSKDTTFLERSLTSAAEPAYNAGVMVFDEIFDERMTWALGAFRAGPDNGGEISKGDSEWAETARVTGVPLMSEDGSSYVHLGFSASHRSTPDDMAVFKAKPESNLAPTFIDIDLPASDVLAWRPELAWTQGPLSIQGEYTLATLDAPSGSDPEFEGWYAQVSYFLTGEHRPYKKSEGAIGPVKPASNALGGNGIGAWELAARYSTLDFSDTDDGELQDITLGVNWYPNPNVRLMLNYVMAELDPPGNAPSGDTNIIELRAQFAF